MCNAKRNVRFAPESGHLHCKPECPLWATEVKFTPSHNEQRIAPHQLLSHEVVGADNLTPELDLAS
jgi:hypothetical protein